MTNKGRLYGCSHGGVWYEPPGYISDYTMGSPPRQWFKTREAAEAALDARRMELRLHIADLTRELESI
jgi:hypothetical protein